MADFKTAFYITMGEEGGYANHKLDKGGETYKGISRKHNPTWPGWKAVDAATARTKNVAAIDRILAADPFVQGAVLALYKTNYWDVNSLDKIRTQAIGNELFDTGVNAGVKTAARMLQEAIGLLTGTYVSVDGIVGPATLSIVNNYPNQDLLMKFLNALQGEHYINLIRNDRSQRVFANTWFGRVFNWFGLKK